MRAEPERLQVLADAGPTLRAAVQACTVPDPGVDGLADRRVLLPRPPHRLRVVARHRRRGVTSSRGGLEGRAAARRRDSGDGACFVDGRPPISTVARGAVLARSLQKGSLLAALTTPPATWTPPSRRRSASTLPRAAPGGGTGSRSAAPPRARGSGSAGSSPACGQWRRGSDRRSAARRRLLKQLRACGRRQASSSRAWWRPARVYVRHVRTANAPRGSSARRSPTCRRRAAAAERRVYAALNGRRPREGERSRGGRPPKAPRETQQRGRRRRRRAAALDADAVAAAAAGARGGARADVWRVRARARPGARRAQGGRPRREEDARRAAAAGAAPAGGDARAGARQAPGEGGDRGARRVADGARGHAAARGAVPHGGAPHHADGRLRPVLQVAPGDARHAAVVRRQRGGADHQHGRARHEDAQRRHQDLRGPPGVLDVRDCADGRGLRRRDGLRAGAHRPRPLPLSRRPALVERSVCDEDGVGVHARRHLVRAARHRQPPLPL